MNRYEARRLLPAVRALRRVWAPIGSALAEAEEADAGFDAGEFSGPWHANFADDEWHRVIRGVADRWGVDEGRLWTATQYWDWEETVAATQRQEHRS